MKNKVLEIKFNTTPKVRVRVINKGDSKEITKEKKDLPFKLDNDVIVTVFCDGDNLPAKFSFLIKKDYVWNGADIPRLLWRVIGASKDNDFLVASMVHDYMLEYKSLIFNEVLEGLLPVSDYRLLTSLIFRQLLKDSDIWVVKANIMSWCVDTFQKTINSGAWRIK
jgi:hypothetical protein